VDAVKAPISASENETPAKPALPKPVLSKPAPIPQPAAYLPPTDAPPSAGGKPMVQIAAVARPEDAAVLVSALRQRGYGVVVRNEPQDKLLHVQVGPFADRVQATAIKEKLLSDGYNAIIKQ
jgi:DedD protein